MRSQPEGKRALVTGVGGQRFFELWGLDNPHFRRFEEARLERNIPLQLIFFLTPQQNESDIPGIANRQQLEIRVIKEASQAPMDIVVWHAHVGLLIYGKQPHVIDLAGEQIVKTFRTYFKIMWDQATVVSNKAT